MKKLIFVLFVLLNGCAANPAYYTSMSSMKLCIDYMTFPSYNINQSARAAELSRRGENCSAYVGAAAERNKSNAEIERILTEMKNSR